jgi:predicted alpha/beta superfamily hydrolase
MTFESAFKRLMLGMAILFGAELAVAQNAAPSANPELLTLHSKIFSNTRAIRVWLPPRYYDKSQADRRYPVFYFTDGIAAFHGRQLDRVAGRLIQSKLIPPTIFVGIDNGGSTLESKNPGSDRANEYLPLPDDFLSPPVPNPQGKLFPAFLEEEVRSLVESRYRTTKEIGLAGASYGAAIALFTVMERPGHYTWLLLESPSLYIGNDALLLRAQTFRQWPRRVYVGAGTNEGAGDAKREMVDDVARFTRSLENSTATCLLIVPKAAHNEDAWRSRLPAALEFLLADKPCPKSIGRPPDTSPSPASSPMK